MHRVSLRPGPPVGLCPQIAPPPGDSLSLCDSTRYAHVTPHSLHQTHRVPKRGGRGRVSDHPPVCEIQNECLDNKHFHWIFIYVQRQHSPHNRLVYLESFIKVSPGSNTIDQTCGCGDTAHLHCGRSHGLPKEWAPSAFLPQLRPGLVVPVVQEWFVVEHGPGPCLDGPHDAHSNPGGQGSTSSQKKTTNGMHEMICLNT